MMIHFYLFLQEECAIEHAYEHLQSQVREHTGDQSLRQLQIIESSLHGQMKRHSSIQATGLTNNNYITYNHYNNNNIYNIYR